VPHILLLEDDADIRSGMEQHFRREGFSVCAHGLAGDALGYLEKSAQGTAPKVDVAVLDLTLPDFDGLDVLRAIRRGASPNSPHVIIVTARGEEIDRVLGLELGADDYLSKPFSTRELSARVRAVLRRSAPPADAPGAAASGASGVRFAAPEAPLAFGPISLDPESRAVHVEGGLLDLTRKEFDLLAHLMKNPRRVLTRDRILQDVWGLEYLGESRTIDAHIRRLRSKLGAAAGLVETVVGVGYRLGSVDG
jgi:DNA-binding response OmpR family regulator